MKGIDTKIRGDDYISVLTKKHWYYLNPDGKIINSHAGKWVSNLFRFDDCNSCLDMNHVFIMCESVDKL